jgi:hypothetical protein
MKTPFFGWGRKEGRKEMEALTSSHEDIRLTCWMKKSTGHDTNDM